MYVCDVFMYVCDVFMYVCDVLMYVCDVLMYVCDVLMYVCDVLMYVCDVLMRSIDRDVETSRRSCESTVIHTVCMLVVGGGSPCMEVRVRGWLACVCVCGLRGDGRGRDVQWLDPGVFKRAQKDGLLVYTSIPYHFRETSWGLHAFFSATVYIGRVCTIRILSKLAVSTPHLCPL